MSHFILGCIVPNNEDDIEGFIHTNLSEYDENLEVDPYVYLTNDDLLDKYNIEEKKDGESLKFEEWVLYYFGRPLNEDGDLTSTYNPNSKWDWYRIGGRWDGYLTDKVIESDDHGFNFDSKHETIEKNMVTIQQHLLNVKKDFNKYACFALLKSDGNWIEEGKMGWWGLVSDEKEKKVWEDEYISILESYPKEYYIVGVDCHI